jgi:hypothetical protein
MNVHIVIPICRPVLSADERLSLHQAYHIFASTPITIIKPATLDLSAILVDFPRLQVEEFDPAYFTSKTSYNSLMLSCELYKRFLHLDYILIYQLDAFVFRDELAEWCNKGYDYIGAPWLQKPIHSNRFYRIGSAFKSVVLRCLGKFIPDRNISRGKVGNGGFSLRRISSHFAVVTGAPECVHNYIALSKHSRFYEDVFWAVEAPQIDPTFRIAPLKEALQFSFDKNPALCYRRNHHRLPFGCHGFNKRKSKHFWKKFIAVHAVYQNLC